MKPFLEKIDKFLSDIFAKLPQLSDKGKENVAKIIPWVILVSVIISIPGTLFLLGITALSAPVNVITKGPVAFFSTALGVVQLVLSLMSLPHLFKRKIKGWQLLFYALLLGAVTSLFSSLFTLVFTLAELYFLYQARGLYSKK